MQRRHRNPLQLSAYIEFAPIFRGVFVIEPIQNVLRQPFPMQRRMISQGEDARLRRKIGPRLLETIARLAQTQPPRIALEHLQSPAQSRSQAQRPVVIKPSMIKVTPLSW